MTQNSRRGYVPGDDKEFGVEAGKKLQMAAEEIYYLLNRGYSMKGASTFVGNHYMLSERQRMALARMISSREQLTHRAAKCKSSLEKGSTVCIDGFNIIITLEIALSGTTLLRCMDETVRDLAGLRGTYRLIDKTPQAVRLAGEALQRMRIGKAEFYLDAPVSNTGRLAACIRQELDGFEFEVETKVIHNVDSVLSTLDHVVTGDAIILDECNSWVNLVRGIIDREFPGYPYVSLGDVGQGNGH